MGRRLVVQSDDVLVVGGLELDAGVLRAMLKTNKRLLWAFLREGDDVRPVAYSEAQVIWLTDKDLERRELPSAV